MEEKQFQKVEQWFTTLNERIGDVRQSINEKTGDIRQSIDGLATKRMVENRFDMLAASMKNLLDRMIKLEERFGKQDMEVIILKLAVKKLEDDVEILRQRVH